MNTEAYKADLIEGIDDGEPWQHSRSFLSLFRVPIAVAVARDHPLASKTCLTLADMQPYTLVTIRSNMSDELDRLQQEAKAVSYTHLIFDSFKWPFYSAVQIESE